MSDLREGLTEYVSHKHVHAAQIEAVQPRPDGALLTLKIGRAGTRTVVVSGKVVARYMPVAGDYYVIYGDDYVSISPRKAFEEGYTAMPETE